MTQPGQITVGNLLAQMVCFQPGKVRRRIMVVRVRKLRSWMLGLYIAAQVIGLVPLVYEHTLDVYKAVTVAGHVQATSGKTQHDSDSHHGLSDSHDQCCAIHSVTGPLAPMVSLAPVETPAMRVSPAELVALLSWHSARLDRPPKSLSLV
jgi:hypothetical protein